MFAHLHLHHPEDGTHHHGHQLGLAAVAVAAAVAVGVTASRVLEDLDRAAVPQVEQVQEVTVAPAPATEAVSRSAVVTESPAPSAPVAPPVDATVVEQVAPASEVAPVSSAVVETETVTAPTATAAVAVQPFVAAAVVVPPGMTVTRATLVGVDGAPVATAAIHAGELRFDAVAPGTYRVVVQAETPVIESNGTAISAAALVTSDLVELTTSAPLVVPIS
jgi:hypothetical protein